MIFRFSVGLSVGWSQLHPGENITGVLDYMNTHHVMEVIGRWGNGDNDVLIWTRTREMEGIGYCTDEYD